MGSRNQMTVRRQAATEWRCRRDPLVTILEKPHALLRQTCPAKKTVIARGRNGPADPVSLVQWSTIDGAETVGRLDQAANDFMAQDQRCTDWTFSANRMQVAPT